MLGQIRVHVLQAFEVLFPPVPLAIRYEGNAIGASQHELAGGAVKRLARHREQLKAHAIGTDGTQINREVVKKERAITTGGQRRQLTDLRARQRRVQVGQIRRLARPCRPVVDQLAGDQP